MHKKVITFVFYLLLLLAVSFSPALAQNGEADWSLNLRRDWGYGMGSDIQGKMTLSLSGDLSNVSRVLYFFNNDMVSEQTREPFRFSFNTDEFVSGLNTIHAEVHTIDGKVSSLSPLVYNFLSSDQASNAAIKMIGSIVGITLLVSALSFFISSRNRGQNKNGIGHLGLAVCKQCDRTFPRSFFGLNMVAGKFERCPHCGKWQITRRASPEQIARADQPFQNGDNPNPEALNEERDELDDSRFVDL